MNPAWSRLLLAIVIHFLLFVAALTTSDPFFFGMMAILTTFGTWGVMLLIYVGRRGARGQFSQWDAIQFQRMGQIANDVHYIKDHPRR